MTFADVAARSSQVQVLSSGIATPAFSSTVGLTAIEKLATPIGAPTWVPSTVPVSSTLGSIADRSSSSFSVPRSVRAVREPYAAM